MFEVLKVEKYQPGKCRKRNRLPDLDKSEGIGMCLLVEWNGKHSETQRPDFAACNGLQLLEIQVRQFKVVLKVA